MSFPPNILPDIKVSKITCIAGGDDFLIDLTMRKCIEEIVSKIKNIEKNYFDASFDTKSDFIGMLSQSLFSEKKLIIIKNANKLSAEYFDFIKNGISQEHYFIFIKKPIKKISEFLLKFGNDFTTINCPEIKYSSDKINFILKIFKDLNTNISTKAAAKIVDACTNIEEIYSLSNQISNDYLGKSVDENIVSNYTDDKIATTIYKVADSVAEFDKVNSIKRFDTLLLSGEDKNKILFSLMSALYTKISRIGKVKSAVQNGINPVTEYKYFPWEVKNIKKIESLWDFGTLKKAISFIANSDYRIKSYKVESRLAKCPEFEVRKCILRLCALKN